MTPREAVDLTALRSLGSTGSPLSADAYDWIYRDVKEDVWLAPISGGTDLAGAFVLGHPGMPVRAGEMQCRALGNAVRAFDPEGNELIGEVGELVCTEPLALHAALLLGRRRRQPPARELFRHLSRHLAARRLDQHRRGRRDR